VHHPPAGVAREIGSERALGTGKSFYHGACPVALRFRSKALNEDTGQQAAERRGQWNHPSTVRVNCRRAGS